MILKTRHIILLLIGSIFFLACSKKGASGDVDKEKEKEDPPIETPDETPTPEVADFTIAIIGDTQNYVDFGNSPDDGDCQAMGPFTDMINWVKNNKTPENIKYVVTLGDITDEFGQTSASAEGQWQRARETYDILLNNNIPFGVVPGNHDMKLASHHNYPNDGTTFMVNPFFNKYFPRSIFPDYNRGSYPSALSNENHYDVINTPAGEFLFIYLRWHHTEEEADPAIDWAYEVASSPSHSNKKIVLITHYTVARSDADSDGKNDWGVQAYQNPGFSQAEKTYNKLKSLPNFFLFLGGHATGEFQRQDTHNGYTVKSFTTDFSNSCGTGSSTYPEGVIRTMKFSASRDVIEFKDFVPGQIPIKQFTRPWRHNFTTSRTLDFNNNGKSDPAFFINGTWKIKGLADISFLPATGNIPIPGDYDADGQTDIAVYRSVEGDWAIQGAGSIAFSVSGGIPVPGDYDGNGTTDFALFVPSTATWYVKQSYRTSAIVQQHGKAGDIPVPADYNGDGKVDFAVFTPSTGEWSILNGGTKKWGEAGDIPVPGDYNGDGIIERATYRPSNQKWYIEGRSDGVNIGQAGDIPVPGDYDGDGKTDIAVYRPTDGKIYLQGNKEIATNILNAQPLNLPYAVYKIFFTN